MASELRVNTLKDASGNNSIATSFVANGSAKAYISIPQDQASISKSFNVSSLDDDGTGDGGINITNAFSDANHAVTMSITYDSGAGDVTRNVYVSTQTASTIETKSGYSGQSADFTFYDVIRAYASHGDLA